jgi:hypothetical protein
MEAAQRCSLTVIFQLEANQILLKLMRTLNSTDALNALEDMAGMGNSVKTAELKTVLIVKKENAPNATMTKSLQLTDSHVSQESQTAMFQLIFSQNISRLSQMNINAIVMEAFSGKKTIVRVALNGSKTTVLLAQVKVCAQIVL